MPYSVWVDDKFTILGCKTMLNLNDRYGEIKQIDFSLENGKIQVTIKTPDIFSPENLVQGTVENTPFGSGFDFFVSDNNAQLERNLLDYFDADNVKTILNFVKSRFQF